MKRVLILFVVLLFVVSAPTVFAQNSQQTKDKDYESFDLGELYVKGEKLPAVQEVTEISEITAADIEATNSKTVAEALAFVPGIKVTTGRKNEPNVQIHGIDQARALILIDGVPYYETNYGKLDLNELPVENVAKIEIQKGVSSVLYGPNALVGVINIVTKKPTTRPAISALAEIGDYRENRFSVSHGMKVGILNYWLNYSHQESKGWYMSRDFDPRAGRVTTQSFVTTPTRRTSNTTTTPTIEDGGVRENSGMKTDAFWAKVGIEPRQGSEYYLNFHYITRDKEAPSPVGPTITNQVFLNAPVFSQFVRIPTYDNWGVDLSGQEKFGDRLVVKGKLFYHDHVDDYDSYSDQNYTNIIATSRFKDNTLGGSLLSDIKLSSTDTLRFAFNYRRDDHKERADEYLPFAESVSYTGSLALENEWNPWKNLSVVAGVGHDWFYVARAEKNNTNSANANLGTPAYGALINQNALRPGRHDELDPMAGVTYTFGDGTRVFGSAAKKVRFPTLQQLFSSSQGNADLLAERSLNLVLGASRSVTQYARAELSFFSHDIDNYITRDAPTVDGRYYNLGRVLLVGFEASGEIYPTKDLTIKAGYTFIDATNLTHGRVTNRVQYVPEHQFDVGVGYLIPKVGVKADLNGLYVAQTWGQVPTPSRRTDEFIKTDDFFVLNARLGKSIGKNFEVYLAGNNILDKNYEPELDFPAAGRNLFLGLKYTY
jgi:iron complex outermembrane recepter protein